MLLPTPVAHDDGKSPEAHMAMKARMPGGPRHSITSLAVAAQTLLPIGGLPQPGGTREPSDATSSPCDDTSEPSGGQPRRPLCPAGTVILACLPPSQSG